MPPAAIAITASYLSVAYTCFSRGLEWRGFAGAGALTVGIVPFTLIFIMGHIKQLERMMAEGKADKLRDAEGLEETRTALSRWSRWNFARAMLPLLGSALGVWNFLAVV